jgi:hypothetical protein
MKKVTFLLLMAMTMCLLSCNSKQSKSEKAAKTFLEKSLVDPSSLKDLKFESMDTLHETFDETVAGKAMLAKADSFKRVSKVYDEMWNDYAMDKSAEALKQHNKVIKEYNKLFKTYKGKEFKGWTMNATFDANNSNGKTIKGTVTFELNTQGDTVKMVRVKNEETLSLFSVDYWNMLK